MTTKRKAMTAKDAAALVPRLAADANKYTRGVCEVVAGQAAFAGAGVLAVHAASCMGAGYVRAYTSEQAAAALRVAQPSAVCLPFDAFAEGTHASVEGKPLAVVVGCGFNDGNEAVGYVFQVLSRAKAPVLVDGGGLAALASKAGLQALHERASKGLATVITPHAGEAERLLDGLPLDDAERSALDWLAKVAGSAKAGKGVKQAGDAWFLAQALRVTCVLKGPDTWIASVGDASLNDAVGITCGTPALAKAGTGDVLAGAIGSLLAGGMPAKDACALGAFVHAQAGVLAAEESCELSVTTEDVLRNLPHAMAALTR